MPRSWRAGNGSVPFPVEIGDGRGFLVGMLGDGCNGLVELPGRVFGGGRVEQLAVELLELSNGRGGHGDASPASAGPIEHCPDQAEAGAPRGADR